MRSKTATFAALVCALLGCTDSRVGATGPASEDGWFCSVGYVRCRDYCLDLRSDENACGACGNSCGAGSTCVGGVCRCPAGRLHCGVAGCPDLQTDSRNCGACGNACGDGESCVDGACRCLPGGQVCEARCVDLRTSVQHCGACGNACADGERCVDGGCRCPAGKAQCGASCVDPRVNVAHCGGCGRACAEGLACVWGRCEAPCDEGMARCGRAACDVDLMSSPEHCGACDHPCRGGTTCRDGWCASEAPAVAATEPVVHPFTDGSTCDARGVLQMTCMDVPNGASRCAAGRCVFTCTSPTEAVDNCDRNSDTGCETRLNTMIDCGACGRACRQGQRCARRGCACPPGQTLCGERCVDLQEGRADCGGCGVACAASDDCVGGRCAPREALRLLAPPSGGVMATRRPVLRWLPGRGEVRASVELCLDRGCARPVTTLEATGASAAVTADLPRGVVYWRVRGRRADGTVAAVSPTWEFSVGARDGAGGGLIGHFADVNGDGLADLVHFDPTVGRICALLGAREGPSRAACAALREPGGWEVPLSGAFALGDFDGDGFTDVASVGNDPEVPRVFLLRGGAAGLTAGGRFDLTDGTGRIRAPATLHGVGDVDGDGYADLAVSQPYDQALAVVVRAGGPDGSRWPTRQILLSQHGASPHFGAAVVNAGDLDADGYGDLVVTSPGTLGWGVVYVHRGGPGRLLGLPSSTLTTPPEFGMPFGGGPVNVGDANGDGYADLGLTGSARIGVYHGGTSGIATTPAESGEGAFPGGGGSSPFAGASDFNGDGLSDLVTLTTAGERTGTFLRVVSGGAGGLAWSSSVLIADKGTTATGVTLRRVGDLNGDGCDDVVTETSSELTVYLGGARSPSLALSQRIPLGAEPL